MNTNQFKHTCTVENAPRFRKWIRERGGIAIWQSIDLSDPGRSWSTPATIAIKNLQGETAPAHLARKCPACIVAVNSHRNCPKCGKTWEEKECVVDYEQPTWQCDKTPSMIITDEKDVGACVDKEVKRFRVAVRRGSQGLTLKCTDHSSRRIRAEVEKAGDGAYHIFDYSTQEAVIMAPVSVVPLNEWKEEES